MPTATTSRSSSRRGRAITCGPRAATCKPGSRCSSAGTVLTPAHVGVLASLGIAEVSCVPRPRVGVVSTGDELVEQGPLPLGSIRDSNRPMLLAVSRSRASCRSTTASRATTSTRSPNASATAVAECDALLTSGAVSMGDFDYVKVVLEQLARERAGSGFSWMQVAIKPAKPLAVRRRSVERAGVRAARQPGVVARELRAVRPTCAAEAGRPTGAAQPDRARPSPHPVRAAGPTASCISTGCASTIVDGRYVCERAGFQASNVLSGMAARRRAGPDPRRPRRRSGRRGRVSSSARTPSPARCVTASHVPREKVLAFASRSVVEIPRYAGRRAGEKGKRLWGLLP